MAFLFGGWGGGKGPRQSSDIDCELHLRQSSELVGLYYDVHETLIRT